MEKFQELLKQGKTRETDLPSGRGLLSLDINSDQSSKRSMSSKWDVNKGKAYETIINSKKTNKPDSTKVGKHLQAATQKQKIMEGTKQCLEKITFSGELG